MSERMDRIDPELNEVLGDPELIRIARLLSRSSTAEPPLDDAFRSGLRRQLMAEAWKTAEGRNAWWVKLLAPQRMAWAGAAAVLVVAASIVFYTANLPAGGVTQTIEVQSPQQDSNGVPVHQAILVSFNQPMDHASTESAVQVTPATTVAFRWGGDTQLYVQPTSGDLAPNTQYQVTIGPGAKTLSGAKLDTPKTVTFVTQPIPSPPPPPSPSPKASALNQVQITNAYPPGGTVFPPVWAADSKTVYVVVANGALQAIPVAGGQPKTLVPGGVSLPAITPAGDRLAYVRGGNNIEILTLATGATSDVPVQIAPTTLRWVNDQLYWGEADGLYRLDASGPTKLGDVSQVSGAFTSIAPDGKHAIAQVGDGLMVLDVATGKTTALCSGGCAAAFQGWSPDGTRVVYGGVIANLAGKTITSLPTASVSWSAKNELLLGSDTSLYEMRPDGGGLTHLADGTYDQPVWAPDSSTFVFVRGGALWSATAPAPPAVPAETDQALAVVNAFMASRLANNPDRAMQYLDDAGRATYNSGSPPLIPTGDPAFKRFYVVMSEVDPSTPNTVRAVVRMVFAHGKTEKTTVEETLTLRREEETDPYLIDAVSASSPRDVGKGPEVVAVKVTATEIDVTFDSDLMPTTVGGVVIQDANGMPVTASQSYSDRSVTLTGLQLTPGAHYRLVVMPTVLDVGGRHTASEYDLDLVGPAASPAAGGVTPTPSPLPTPSTPGSPAPASPVAASPSPANKS
jgi:Big-like domain-containing protein